MLHEKVRLTVRGILITVLDEEVNAFIGADRYERSDQQRDRRNGTYPRSLGTSVGQIADVRGGQTQTQLFEYVGNAHLDRLRRGRTSGTGTWGIYDESYDYNPFGNLTNKGGVLYTYPAPGSARPHAVSSTSNGGSFSYGENGNMTGRRLKTGDPTYMQTWDDDTRLKTVTVSGQTTTFNYDGVAVTTYAGAGFEVEEVNLIPQLVKLGSAWTRLSAAQHWAQVLAVRSFQWLPGYMPASAVISHK
jgi:hypothetical protein